MCVRARWELKQFFLSRDVVLISHTRIRTISISVPAMEPSCPARLRCATPPSLTAHRGPSSRASDVPSFALLADSCTHRHDPCVVPPASLSAVHTCTHAVSTARRTEQSHTSSRKAAKQSTHKHINYVTAPTQIYEPPLLPYSHHPPPPHISLHAAEISTDVADTAAPAEVVAPTPAPAFSFSAAFS